MSTRIQLANRGYYGLEKALKSKALSKNLKIKMYMNLLRPAIILYSSETWALRKTEELINDIRKKISKENFQSHI